MKKLIRLINSDFVITDTGQTVPAEGELVIDPANYSLYSRSDDVITALASSELGYNDGSSDLSLADATRHLQGSFPKDLTIDKAPPFANKKILVNGVIKSLYKRVHGVSLTITAGTTGYIDLVIPHDVVKFTGAEIFGVQKGDQLDFLVLDTPTNTISGLDVPTYGANFLLVQFGFNVKMPASGEYENTSNYDPDLIKDMVIEAAYKNNGASDITVDINFELHEVV